MGERQIELHDGHILLGGRVFEGPKRKGNWKDIMSENDINKISN